MECSKGNWKVGKFHGVVVTDNGEGFKEETGHSAVDYYGGFLIAESIAKVGDAKIIAEAKRMYLLIAEIVDGAEDEGEIRKGTYEYKMKEILDRIHNKV